MLFFSDLLLRGLLPEEGEDDWEGLGLEEEDTPLEDFFGVSVPAALCGLVDVDLSLRLLRCWIRIRRFLSART